MASVLPTQTDAPTKRRVKKELSVRAQDEGVGVGSARVIESDDSISAIVAESENYDLLVIGLTRNHTGGLSFGNFVSTVAKDAKCACLIIGGGRK